MKFGAYFDAVALADAELAPWVQLGRILKLMHGASAATRHPFAIAFPDWMEQGFTLGKRLRVFTLDREAGEGLQDALSPEVEDWCVSTRVRTAPATDHYVAYLMHRIPSGISRPDAPDAQHRRELQAQARSRRIAQQQALPFLTMRSSKGHKFRLVIERVTASADASGKPNGYGLSRASQIVALPHL